MATRFCPRCGAPANAQVVYCPQCGEHVVGAPLPAQPPGVGASASPPLTLHQLLSRAVSGRTLVAPLVGGGLLWIFTHQISTTIATALIMLGITTGLRLADGQLAPLWRAISQIPRRARVAIGAGIPILLSLVLLGPGASGKEVSRARLVLILTTVIAYVFLRPRGEPATAR